MADSVYISKNLTTEQLRFMQLLEAHELLYFEMADIESQIDYRFSNLNEILENLTAKGVLERIERGIYVLNNYKNINVLATFICAGSSISYWSALHHHGLTDRFPNTVFVKTTRRKRETEILGTHVKYVTVKENKHLGIITEGYGDDSFPVTDVAVTLVDCFDQPRYGGDFPDLINAFANARLTNNKLIEYTKAYQNIALTKRFGYLAELFHADSLRSFIQYAKNQVNNKYTLIDAGGTDEGEFLSEWKIRLNVGEKELTDMAQSRY